ncbi:MAG TPA: metal-sensing transcriptional repressor [Candidatus Coprocola pullicola]|nr:metal-sensing transcriptional repressor [Candidatus Coprocola pullicola]
MKADQKQIVRLLKTARGQIDGILKMVEEDRYCVDISNQILATDAILRKANKEILRAHMKCCVKDAFQTGQEDKKIDELIDIIDKLK